MTIPDLGDGPAPYRTRGTSERRGASMRVIRILAWAGAAAMAVVLTMGFRAGGFADEGSAILDLAWGRVTMTDLGIGLLLAAAWVGWREQRPSRAIPWVLGVLVLGNLTTAVYLALAAGRSEDVVELLVGPHADRAARRS
jgi:hypothetical protein